MIKNSYKFPPTVFPVKKAYSFAIKKGLGNEVQKIKRTKIVDPIYGGTTQARRASIINLLGKNNLWEEFLNENWSMELSTREGIEIINELKRDYPSIFGKKDEEDKICR